VRLQTCFPLLIVLLGFISVVCHGQTEEMIHCTTSLTWFEEWYLYYEVLHGKSLGRWFDVSDKYGISSTTCRNIYDNKLNKLLSVQEWSWYVPFDKDKTYGKQDKWEAYEGKRVIMFDNTNITMR
jgi:hypothetical protein